MQARSNVNRAWGCLVSRMEGCTGLVASKHVWDLWDIPHIPCGDSRLQGLEI
jgi:hypothetical protein